MYHPDKLVVLGADFRNRMLLPLPSFLKPQVRKISGVGWTQQLCPRDRLGCMIMHVTRDEPCGMPINSATCHLYVVHKFIDNEFAAGTTYLMGCDRRTSPADPFEYRETTSGKVNPQDFM